MMSDQEARIWGHQSSIEDLEAGETREFLRQVSEDVRASFPRQVTAASLILVDVDPKTLHAFWSVPISVMDSARAQPGALGAPMILRLEPVANGARNAVRCIDVQAGGLQDSAYIGIRQNERRYRGTLGLRNGDGTLIPLATSNEIALPSAGPAAEDRASPSPRPELCDPFLSLFEPGGDGPLQSVCGPVLIYR
jgi:hypothetical protein